MRRRCIEAYIRGLKNGYKTVSEYPVIIVFVSSREILWISTLIIIRRCMKIYKWVQTKLYCFLLIQEIVHYFIFLRTFLYIWVYLYTVSFQFFMTFKYIQQFIYIELYCTDSLMKNSESIIDVQDKRINSYYNSMDSAILVLGRTINNWNFNLHNA